MKLVDFVKPELVVGNIEATDKPGVLAELAGHVAARLPGTGLDADALARVLADRERLASTAIGEGVAIPHGKLAGLEALVGCVARSVAGVDFESMDGRPTHIFFVLLAPEHSTGMHLKALARISRLFKDPDFRARLLSAATVEDMYRVIADEDAKY